MYSRILNIENEKSFLLLGPRGTGKSTWIAQTFPDAIVIDLLDPPTFNELLAAPERLVERIPKKNPPRIVIDEIQRVPELLNVVHQCIEKHGTRFGLTASSARKLAPKV